MTSDAFFNQGFKPRKDNLVFKTCLVFAWYTDVWQVRGHLQHFKDAYCQDEGDKLQFSKLRYNRWVFNVAWEGAYQVWSKTRGLHSIWRSVKKEGKIAWTIT